MIVSKENFDDVVNHLSQTGFYGLDTETYGLKYKDKLFSIIINDGQNSFYFNFHEYEDGDQNFNLPRFLTNKMVPIFNNPKSTFYIHNAVFDLMKLELSGVTIKGKVLCSLVGERLLRNNYMSYSLDHLSRIHLGVKKDDKVEKYISKNKCFTQVTFPGKLKKFKLKHYEKVPLDIIAPYGDKDARLHYELGVNQYQRLEVLPELTALWSNEQKLIHVCKDMMSTGIKVDETYTRKALDNELYQIEVLKDDFEAKTGKEFKDSSKLFSEIWEESGHDFQKTEKGNPCFDKKALQDSKHPLAETILSIRGLEKRTNTYYSSFLYYMGDDNILHANIRQSGTETGRMSMSSPSLHNVPKEDDEEDKVKPFIVRKCFVPRNEKVFISIDFDQQEFRMLLDYAGEMDLIKKINEGHDVHQATADLLGVKRRIAKNLNFGLLYGMGVNTFSKNLSITYEAAYDLRRHYFSKLPRVKKIMEMVKDRAVSRGYITNWCGRRLHLKDPDKSYIMINHLIQGGCADVMKFSMNDVYSYMKKKKMKSKILLQVHDELLFEMDPSELHEVEEMKSLMESVYNPYNGMLLTCSVEHSFVSWGSVDKKKGLP